MWLLIHVKIKFVKADMYLTEKLTDITFPLNVGSLNNSGGIFLREECEKLENYIYFIMLVVHCGSETHVR